MKKKYSLIVATLMLLLLRVTSTYGINSFNNVFVETNATSTTSQTPCEQFDILVILVNNTLQQVEALVAELPENDDQTTSLKDELGSASDEFDEAVSLGKEGFCETAINLLYEILEKLSEIASEALEQESSEDDDYEKTVRSIEFNEKIERAKELLSNIWEAVSQLQSSSINVNNVSSMLNLIQEKLELVEEAISGSNFEEAEELLSEIEELFEEANKMVKELNKPKTVKRASDFFNKTRDRVLKLETQIILILTQENASEKVLDSMGEAFQDVYNELEDIEELISLDNLENALEDFDDFFDELEHTYDILDDAVEEAGEKLEDLAELESWIDYLEDQITELETMGFNVTELWSTMEQINSDYTELKEKIEQGQFESLEEQIEQLEETMETLENKISKILDELEKQEEDKEKEEKDQQTMEDDAEKDKKEDDDDDEKSDKKEKEDEDEDENVDEDVDGDVDEDDEINGDKDEDDDAEKDDKKDKKVTNDNAGKIKNKERKDD